MFSAIQDNLDAGIKLLNTLDNKQYRDNSVKPYHSSIGGHVRHILDIYNCIFEGLDSGEIDLSARPRNREIECFVSHGLRYFQDIKDKLSACNDLNMDRLVVVCDDLGRGPYVQTYTLGAVFIQAHSHATHHFASIGYILAKLGLDVPKQGFGYNPTTPCQNLAPVADIEQDTVERVQLHP